MTLPTDRETFIATCLRRNGAPVIQVNVEATQLDDIVDQALEYWYDYHYDGSEKFYFRYRLTQADITNQFIPMPENVLSVVSIFDIGGINSIASGSSLFSIPYQYAMDTLTGFNAPNLEMAPYVITRMDLELLQQTLTGKQPIRFNRHSGKLWIDMDWTRVIAGQFIVAEAYRFIDPSDMPDVWSDRWLLRYASAMIKRQWGMNMIKFTGMTLPGGVQFNGQKIYDDGQAEMDKLEDQMLDAYSMPPDMIVG